MKRHNFEDVSRQTFTHHPNLCMVLDCCLLACGIVGARGCARAKFMLLRVGLSGCLSVRV